MEVLLSRREPLVFVGATPRADGEGEGPNHPEVHRGLYLEPERSGTILVPGLSAQILCASMGVVVCCVLFRGQRVFSLGPQAHGMLR
eukprot:11277680-Alexandrium_andersonii.AAC.1